MKDNKKEYFLQVFSNILWSSNLEPFILTLEIIEDFAKKYNKVVIVVSHDYEFLNTVADGVYKME